MSYAEIMSLISDDELWEKKAELAAALLETRANAAHALDETLIEMFKVNEDVKKMSFRTSSGRPARLILAVGEEAAAEADDLYGAD